jgi:hypothetical protein
MCEAHRWFGDDCKRICSKIPAPPTTRSNADSEHVPAQQPQVSLQQLDFA